MCLKFSALFGGGGQRREDYGPAAAQKTATSDQGPAAPKSGEAFVATGGSTNGERAAAVSNSSDADVPSGGVLRDRKGDEEMITALTPAPGGQAPQTNEYVAAGAAHHGSPVAASQQKKATDKMGAAPAPQVARQAEDDDDPVAANNVNGDPNHGGEDDRKARGKS